MKQVLVVHALSHRMRRTTKEFVLGFGRYAPADVEVVYHNVRRPAGRGVQGREFDALILPYDILSLRSATQWSWVLETVAPLAERADRVLAFPQDDYTYNEVLDDGLYDLGVDIIYTPIETGLDLVYPKMSSQAEIRTALTGYVDEITAAERRSRRIPIPERPIDVGQRVRMLPAWFGRKGRDKGLFAELFAAKAAGTSLAVDISTRDEDAFAGDEWYRFLGKCAATIGQKGGASLCDPDGSIMDRVVAYLEVNPTADFDEIEAACFPEADGQAVMSALSPRLFDAAMCGTAQILVEDDYLGVLEPWVHYIPTDQQLTNFDELVAALADHALLTRVAAAAEAALIESGSFSYQRFVSGVFKDSVSDSGRPSASGAGVDVAEELQWRLTADLFEAVQRVTYLAWSTGSTSSVARLAETVESLLAEEPQLTDCLDATLLTAIVGPVHLHPALASVFTAVVDTLVECFRAGGARSVAKWFRQVDRPTTSTWELLDWVERERVELDLGVAS